MRGSYAQDESSRGAEAGADGARRFRRWSVATLIAVYLLILVGGIVRATGSGMGCPDWPKCFGQWIPPTAEEQLPADYQERWAEHGYGEARFNVAKTWTEYLNRLIGVVIGLLILMTAVRSLAFWRSRRSVVWLSFAAFLLVGFQGWLGSVVVSSNLEPWLVTVHMLVALVIVALLIAALGRSARGEALLSAGLSAARLGRLRAILMVAMALSLVQIALGTQVREIVDELLVRGVPRALLMERGGDLVLVHRSFALLLLATNVWLARIAWRSAWRPIRWLGGGVVAVVVLEAAVGAALYYLAVPASLQPVHLLLGALLAGLQFALWTITPRPADLRLP